VKEGEAGVQEPGVQDRFEGVQVNLLGVVTKVIGK